MVELLVTVPYPTIRSWIEGRRAVPQWAYDTLAGYLEKRGGQMLALARGLRDLAKKRPAARPGFRAIDPETGLSGRPRVGRKRKVKEV
jgi:hypothetical protein